jgi:putative sterol carrier protein
LGRFKDESDVYALIGRLVQELAADPELAAQVKTADTSVQYQMTDPDSQITLEMRPDREIRVDLGPSDLDPEVVMIMTVDTAHGFWLGQVNVTTALARGEIKARGPVAKIIRLVPLVEPSFPRYEQILRDAGRTDLLEAA